MGHHNVKGEEDAVPALEDVYQKFGFAAKAAQLLETELGTMLLQHRCLAECLLAASDPARAADVLSSVNRHTLGQLLKSLNNRTQSLDALSYLMSAALRERNRLFHSFYRDHNFRRNSDEGREIMLSDLKAIHCSLLNAYIALLAASSVDIDHLAGIKLPTCHLPI
jgi:hypothetical protein